MTKLETGCLIHDRMPFRQQIRELVALGSTLGWQDEDPVGTARVLDSDELEEIMDLGDEVESWLNDKIAEPGYVFGWMDGEFFYMENDWWAES